MEKIDLYNVIEIQDASEQIKLMQTVMNLADPKYIRRLIDGPRVVVWASEVASLDDRSYYMSRGATELMREEGLVLNVVAQVRADQLPRSRALLIGDQIDWEHTGPS